MKFKQTLLLYCMLYSVLFYHAPSNASDKTPLPTVASINLCTDLVVLRLADPEQIVALSQASHDQRLSPVVKQARRYPAIQGQLEELIYLQPERVVVHQGWSGLRHRHILERAQIQVVEMPYPRNWASTRLAAQQVADQIQRSQHGRQVIAALDQRWRALPKQRYPYRTVYLRPNGGSAGHQTYIDEVLTHLGLNNGAALSGYHGWGPLSLEHLLMNPPELWLLGYFDQQNSPLQHRYARQPRLQDLLQQAPVIRIPGQAWGCGGFELLEVARLIIKQLATGSSAFDERSLKSSL
jgi:iron complex transport system substrate-binding protein